MLNVAANAVLIPAYGVYGAAVATLLTWSIYMVVCWAIANAEHRLPVSRLAYARMGLLVAAVYGAADATRVGSWPVQVALDGLWAAVFCAAAYALFFGPAERAGARALMSESWGRVRRMI